jgi:hypothetical protein
MKFRKIYNIQNVFAATHIKFKHCKDNLEEAEWLEREPSNLHACSLHS